MVGCYKGRVDNKDSVEEHAQMPSHEIGKLVLLQGPLDYFVFCLFLVLFCVICFSGHYGDIQKTIGEIWREESCIPVCYG